MVEKRYLTLKSLCEYLDLKPSQVYWMLYRRMIPKSCYKKLPTGRLLFDKIEIDKWLKEDTAEKPPLPLYKILMREKF